MRPWMVMAVPVAIVLLMLPIPGVYAWMAVSAWAGFVMGRCLPAFGSSAAAADAGRATGFRAAAPRGVSVAG